MRGWRSNINPRSDPAGPDALDATAARMAAALHHRGPDDGGVWIDAEAGIALGFH